MKRLYTMDGRFPERTQRVFTNRRLPGCKIKVQQTKELRRTNGKKADKMN